jgi:long-chain acyl-CoA synthetase
MSETLTLLSGGSEGEPRTILRSVKSWSESMARETKVFQLSHDERYVAMGNARHSLWAYAKFRAKAENRPFMGISRLNSHRLKLMVQSNPTAIYSIPQLASLCIKALARHSLVIPSLRQLLLGGAALPWDFPWELQKAMLPNAEVWMFYGSAEASFIGYSKPGAPYTLFPDVEINIDQNERLWVRSPMTINPGEWINTGDLAVMIQGKIQIIGRSQRQVSSQGQSFPVEPVERLLENFFNAKKVAILQNAAGNLLCLVMVRPMNTFSNRQAPRVMSLEAINRVIKANVASFPAVNGCHYLAPEHWPLTYSGKTDWRALRESIDHLGS